MKQLSGDIVLVEGANELNVQMEPRGVPPPGKGLIWGFVTDSLTGEAVPDVRITLDGLERYTEWAGQYEFRDLAIRQYQIVFSKEGYETVTRYATPDTQLNVTLPPIVPTKPELVYAEPVEAVIASGATGHINYKVGIPNITSGYILIFLFPLEGVRCWTPYGCANVNFRAGATAGYYEGSASWYVKYMTDHFKFANIPRGTYRLLSTCELYRDGNLVKTYWSNVDTGEVVTVGEYLPQPDMVVTYLRFEPTVIYLGDSVRIWVNVGNEGKATGSITVTCKVNGVVIGAKTVTREPGHWAGLSFYFTPEEIGTYDVEVNGLSGTFEVI